MFRRASPRAFERRRRHAAVAVSLAVHAVLAVLIVPRLGRLPIESAPRPEMLIVSVDRDSVPALRHAPVAEPAPNQVRPSQLDSGQVARPAATAIPEGTPIAGAGEPAPNQDGGGQLDSGQVSPEGPSYRGVLKEREREAIAEALNPKGNRLVPWIGAPGTPGGARQPDDSIDGRPRLGSGEPGDPVIPGSGGVDIAKVITRDGRVAQAQERARQGTIHPFIGEVKDRVETCWLPVAEDVSMLWGKDFVEVPDPVCAKRFHLRHKAGRVFTIHDPAGSRLAIEIDTGRDSAAQAVLRGIREKIRRAFDEAGMKEVPAELLDERGLLRLAWNVYIDDYRGCGLMGAGANAHKPGGDEIIGIVELDGAY